MRCEPKVIRAEDLAGRPQASRARPSVADLERDGARDAVLVEVSIAAFLMFVLMWLACC